MILDQELDKFIYDLASFISILSFSTYHCYYTYKESKNQAVFMYEQIENL